MMQPRKPVGKSMQFLIDNQGIRFFGYELSSPFMSLRCFRRGHELLGRPHDEVYCHICAPQLLRECKWASFDMYVSS